MSLPTYLKLILFTSVGFIWWLAGRLRANAKAPFLIIIHSTGNISKKAEPLSQIPKIERCTGVHSFERIVKKEAFLLPKVCSERNTTKNSLHGKLHSQSPARGCRPLFST